jgi:hypothetical protein
MVLPLSLAPLRRLAALLAVALAFACGLGSLAVWLGLPSTQLAAARSRWSERAPAHYRMVSEAGARCVQDVEVSGGRIVAVHRNDHCSPPARTVDELFRLIDGIRVVNYPCVSFNCACRSVMGTSTEYDGALGFPRAITLWSRREPNWWAPSLWRYLASSGAMPPCSRRSEAVIVRVVEFTAIP